MSMSDRVSYYSWRLSCNSNMTAGEVSIGSLFVPKNICDIFLFYRYTTQGLTLLTCTLLILPSLILRYLTMYKLHCMREQYCYNTIWHLAALYTVIMAFVAVTKNFTKLHFTTLCKQQFSAISVLTNKIFHLTQPNYEVDRVRGL